MLRLLESFLIASALSADKCGCALRHKAPMFAHYSWNLLSPCADTTTAHSRETHKGCSNTDLTWGKNSTKRSKIKSMGVVVSP